MEHTIPQINPPAEAKTDLRIRRSRESLRATLMDLLEGKSFEAITIREIAALAGVGYNTFFRHYPGKEALLDDIAADEIRRLTDRALPIYNAVDPSAACLALCSYVDEHRTLWTALLTGGAAPMVREEMLRQGQAATAGQATSHVPAPDGGAATALVPPELGIALAVAGMFELLSWWLRQPAQWPATRVAEVMFHTSIAPLLRAP